MCMKCILSKTLVPLVFLIFTNSGRWKAQALYFPPINGSETWDTLSPAALGWCTNKIDSLYNYLQQENTKGFMVLKDGKIVLEKYFGTFTKDSAWYWASAGKTLTSFLIGQAQEEGFLKITDRKKEMFKTSGGKYIAPQIIENQIKLFSSNLFAVLIYQ